jgi:predicted dehydrogenase
MRAHGGFEVVALVDRRADRARAEAERLGVPTGIVGRVVDDVPVAFDVVTCGTAPFTHFEVVMSALDAGKHVITEKPFTMTVEEGEVLAASARANRLQLAVVHNFQFARSITEVDAWIGRGRLGSIRSIWAMQLSNPRRRLPAWYDELPLGLFYDESPHLLYLIRHFAGAELELDAVSVAPSTISATANTPAQIVAQYGAPLPIALTMNFEAPVSEWHVGVLGERGAAVIDVFRDIAAFVPNDGLHQTGTVLRTSLSASFSHWLGYLRSGPRHLRGRLLYGNDEVFARFARAIASGEPPAGISVDDALAVLRAQHEIVVASRVGDARSSLRGEQEMGGEFL